MRAVAYRRFDSWGPGVYLAQGPRVIRDPGGGSMSELYGYTWMLVLERDPVGGGDAVLPHLYQLTDAGEPHPITGGVPARPRWVEHPTPFTLPSRARRAALAFDQAAAPVVAYEYTQNIYVAQFDPGSGDYVYRGPFEGVDPVIIADAVAMGGVDGSQVRVLHLSRDRKTVLERIQSESYATGHAVLTLDDEATLDMILVGPGVMEVLGALASNPDDELVIRERILWGVEESAGGATAAWPASGLYQSVIEVVDLRVAPYGVESAGEAAAAWPSTALYKSIIIEEDLRASPYGVEQAGQASAAWPSSALYKSVIREEDLRASPYGVESAGQANAAWPASGLYDMVVVIQDLRASPYGVESAGSASASWPTEGSYEPA